MILPEYSPASNEPPVLGISQAEWESAAEAEEVYRERAPGIVKDEREIMRAIAARLPFRTDPQTMEHLAALRIQRMRRAVDRADPEAARLFRRARKSGIRIGLISNADVTDRKYRSFSALARYFDDAVFSCDVGMMKPDPRIYRLAMKRPDVSAGESVFIGDGGSGELEGAKAAGMKTVLSEALLTRSAEEREGLLRYADMSAAGFRELWEKSRISCRAAPCIVRARGGRSFHVSKKQLRPLSNPFPMGYNKGRHST